MSNIKPESYFFTGLPTPTQIAAQAFGPVVGNESSQFRTTAKFTTTSTIKAHAICTGQVFIQPGTDTNKVNLVLRPYRQPIKGLHIKYFIYRGLNRVDFLSSVENLIPHSGLSSASEFINIIWEQLKKFNDWDDSEANSQNFEAKWIGYDPTNQPADSLVDDYFFMANLVDDDDTDELAPFEFPMIKQGTHLGNFSGDYGLDIILSDGDYKALSSDTGFQLDLAFIRAQEGLLNTAVLPTNTTEKQYRETVFKFMDPAAYYGLHYDNGKVSVKNGDNTTEKEGQLIYDDLLANFYTKNNVYLYLQNHLGRSYNYYENYNAIDENGDVLKTGITTDTMQSSLPSTHSWPLLIQNDAQNHPETNNTIHLQFAVGNQNPLCFVQIGKAIGTENDFLVSKQLLPTQPEAIDGQVPQTNTFSQPVSIVLPNTAGVGTEKLNVAHYVKLIYTGANLNAVSIANGETVLHTVKPIDTLFNPVHIAPRFANTNANEISWCVSHQNNLIDTNLINEANTSKIVCQTKIIFDKLAYIENDQNLTQDRVIYETQLIEGIGKGLFARSNSRTSSENAGSVPFDEANNNFYRLANPYFFENIEFTDGNTLVKGVQVKEKTFEELNKFLLGISKTQNEQLLALASNNNYKNTRIYLKDLSPNSYYISIENINYSRYMLGIIVENSNTELEIILPNEDIIIYTTDYLAFYSLEYLQYMPPFNELLNEDDLLTRLNVY